MKNLYQTAGAHLRLLADPTHGDAVQVVHGRCRGDQLIPIKAFGKNLGGSGLKYLLTVGAIFFREAVNNPLGLQRLTFDYQPFLHAFVF
jgi:hypothetical protein